ncbi:hypothetical protein [Streptomyces sp. NBC_01012]|uniref:hypothetical protein n=1 Tax=Streptomyces sp. NBC_01012 TaxID=2903717 RepID=UPI00386D7CDC|nr:hypothetical protein OG623_06320 [Streptomyces sp. NBC_01012]
MHRPPLAAVLVMAAALLAGCASGDDDWSQRRPSPSAVGALGAGFIGQDTSPAPESTVTPRPGSWSEVRPAAGTRVVLLGAGGDRPTKTLVKAVKAWADEADVDLRTETASDDTDLLPAVIRAIDLHPDLVISVGNDLIDPLTTVSPSHLSQDFLVVGAELAEPTENVTAVDWSGASYRGEGLGMSSTYDPASFTDARCAAAVRAGTAAVLTGHTGIVVWLDDH